MKLIMFGPPGSGKGTHGDLLSKELHIPKVSMGDLVRAEVASGSLLGKQMKPVMERGGLVDDKTIIELLRRFGHTPRVYPRRLPPDAGAG